MRSFSIPLNFSHECRLLQSPDTKIPKELEIPILLIRNELKSRMLFNHLEKIGLDGCYFETSLDHLILASLRMWDGTDKTFNTYSSLIEKWSKDVNPDDEVLTRRAVKIYQVLTRARNRKSRNKSQRRNAKRKAIKN